MAISSLDFDQLINDVRDANPIEDVIGEFTKLRKVGAHYVAEKDASFAVFPHTNTYKQFGKGNNIAAAGEGGDVFIWLQKRGKATDFKDALRQLADRGRVTMPDMGPESGRAVAAMRKRQDVMSVVFEWAQAELWMSSAAIAYCRSRGWRDETIHRYSVVDEETVLGAGLGYTGDGWEARDRLRTRLTNAGIPEAHPIVAAFIGWKGDVAAWWKEHAEDLHAPEAPQDWVEKGRISGLPARMLLYPYYEGGHPVHAHARAIDPNIDDANKHRHLKSELVGPKRPFFNFKFSRTANGVAVVEGEGDAITWGQLGWGAIGLGSRGSEDVNEHAARVLRSMVDKARTVVYLTPDNEAAESVLTGPQDETPDNTATSQAEREAKLGERLAALKEKAAESLDKFLDFGEAIGPRVRVVTLPAKDTNAWDVQASPSGVDVMKLLRAAPTLVDVLAARAGDAGREETRDDDIRRALRAVGQLGKQDLEHMREKLAQAMGLKMRQFNAMLKAALAEDEADEEKRVRQKENETPEILVSNPILVDGHFMDVVYSARKDRQMLAVRYPDGRIDQRDAVTIGANTYRAGLHPHVYEAARQPANPNTPPAILFAADVGDKDYTITQLTARVWAFTMRYVDIPDDKRRIFCAYVLLTWLHDCFYDVGYARALGPWGKGKSRFVAAFGFLCYRAIRAAGLSTLSPFFRIKSCTPGTFIIDEINNPSYPTPPELEMFFNLGISVFSPPIWRSEGKESVPTAFNDTFGPKIFGAIKEFTDPATNSRCVDVKMTVETNRTDIEPINAAFAAEAEALRGDLMRFRMRLWQPERQLRTDLLPSTLSGRVKQIAAALMSIADDDDTRASLIAALTERNDEIISLQAGGVEAKTVRALCIILSEPIKQPRNGRPYRDLRMQRVYEMVREMVFDEEGAEPAHKPDGEKNANSPRNDPKHWINRSFSARRIGDVVRTSLGIKTELATWSTAKPRVAILSDSDWPKMRQLMALYGVTEDDLKPPQPELAQAPDANEPPAPATAELTETVPPPPPPTFDDEFFAGLEPD